MDNVGTFGLHFLRNCSQDPIMVGQANFEFNGPPHERALGVLNSQSKVGYPGEGGNWISSAQQLSGTHHSFQTHWKPKLLIWTANHSAKRRAISTSRPSARLLYNLRIDFPTAGPTVVGDNLHSSVMRDM